MSPGSPNVADRKSHSRLIPGLELMRGLASFQVFFSHLFLIFVFINMPVSGRPFFLEAFLNWSSEAVLVFFVLSGFVIALSQKQQHRGALQFLRARLRRLSPIYLAVIPLAILADHMLKHHFNFRPVWGHLLFLQTSRVPATPLFYSDPPLWSLSFEFYFYFFFALTISERFPWSKSALWVAAFFMMGLSCLGLGYAGIIGHLGEILAYMPVWLLGVTLVGKPIYFRPALGQNIVLFGIMFLIARGYYEPHFYSPVGCMVLALFIAPLLYSLAHPLAETTAPYARLSWLIVAVIYLLAVLALVLRAPGGVLYPYWKVNFFWMAVPPILALGVWLEPWLWVGRTLSLLPWQNPALFLGRISYAIYVVHWPVCNVLHARTYHIPIRMAGSLVLVLFLAWILEYKVHPYLCGKFDRIWPKSLATVKGPTKAPLLP